MWCQNLTLTKIKERVQKPFACFQLFEWRLFQSQSKCTNFSLSLFFFSDSWWIFFGKVIQDSVFSLQWWIDLLEMRGFIPKFKSNHSILKANISFFFRYFSHELRQRFKRLTSQQRNKQAFLLRRNQQRKSNPKRHRIGRFGLSGYRPLHRLPTLHL